MGTTETAKNKDQERDGSSLFNNFGKFVWRLLHYVATSNESSCINLSFALTLHR